MTEATELTEVTELAEAADPAERAACAESTACAVPAVLLLGTPDPQAWEHLLRAAAGRGLATLAVLAPDAGAAEPIENSGSAENSESAENSAPAKNSASEATETVRLDGVQGTEIVDRAVGWSRRYALRGVLPLHEDYLEAAGLVADLLELPGPGLRASRVCRGALPPRGYLDAWTARIEPVPPAARARVADGWTAFPAVVRRAGRSSGAGGLPVRTADELRAAFEVLGSQATATVEERPAGEEREVVSLSLHREVEMLEIADVPDPLDRRLLLAAHRAILERLAFGSGAVRAWYRQTAGRPPVLLRISAVPPPDPTVVERCLDTLTAASAPARH